MAYIFWGYIFSLVDFNINSFDLLPDFIGYLLIFIGVHNLSVISKYFNKARIFAVIMTVLTFSDLLHFDTITIEQDFFAALLVLANLILSFVPIYLMYLITRGIGDLEQQCGNDLGFVTLLRLWKAVFLFTVLVYVLMQFATQIYELHTIILFVISILIIGAFIAMVAWVVCIYIAKKRYANSEQIAPNMQKEPLVHSKSIWYAFVVGLVIFFLTVLSYSEYANIMRSGLYYVEHFASDKYRITEYFTSDSDYVTIDWNDVQSAVGKELYRNGDCVIYISAIQDDQNGGYRIFFTAEGDYGYRSGRLVTPLSHKDTTETDGEVALDNIHQNWPNDAVLHVKIGNHIYVNKQWCGRAQSIEPGFDEIGYSMFSIEHYERGELQLTEEIRKNGNEVQVRLTDLKEITYRRR